MKSALEVKLAHVLDVTQRYVPAFSPKTEHDIIFSFVLTELLPDALSTCSAEEVPDFDGGSNSAYVYREDVYTNLLETKERIQAVIDIALDTYRKQVKVMSQAFSRVYALQNAKEPSAKAIAAALEVSTTEHNKLPKLMAVLRDAQRAEEYFRSVPASYKSQDVDDILWTMMMILRAAAPATDSVSLGLHPRAREILSDLTYRD